MKIVIFPTALVWMFRCEHWDSIKSHGMDFSLLRLPLTVHMSATELQKLDGYVPGLEVPTWGYCSWGPHCRLPILQTGNRNCQSERSCVQGGGKGAGHSWEV